MISCYLIGCGRMNLRDANGLALIGDIGMYSYFLFLCIQSLESNQGLSCQCRRIKGKGNVDASLFGFCGKGFACGYFLSVYKDRFSGFLVHQLTSYGVLSSDFQSLIGNGINDHSLFLGLFDMILCILSYCGGVNLRDVYSLILIVDVCVYGNLDSLILHVLKGNNGLWCKNGSIKGKDDIDTSLRLLSGEGSACSDFLIIN